MVKSFPKTIKQKSGVELKLPPNHVFQPQGQGPVHFTAALLYIHE